MTIIAEKEQSPEIKIRQAHIDDLAAIFHLGEKVFTPRDFSNLYRTWDEYEVTNLFNSESEHMLVATIEQRVIGFALGTTIEKVKTAWNYGHLIWLGIDPEFARRGIAGKLFDEFRNIMEEEGVRILIVDTQADNKKAIQFFKKQGFTNPIDHVYMTLNLESEQEEQ